MIVFFFLAFAGCTIKASQEMNMVVLVEEILLLQLMLLMAIVCLFSVIIFRLTHCS